MTYVVVTNPCGWVRNGYIRRDPPPEHEAGFTPPYEPVYDQATVDALKAKITEYEVVLDNYEAQGRRW